MEWGKKRSLEFDFSVVEPVAADNLQLEDTFEVRGEIEGGGVSGDDDGIDHILVLIYQLERAAVTRRLKRQLITFNIYGRSEFWGLRFWFRRLCWLNTTYTKRNRTVGRTCCLHERGHHEDAQSE